MSFKHWTSEVNEQISQNESIDGLIAKPERRWITAIGSCYLHHSQVRTCPRKHEASARVPSTGALIQDEPTTNTQPDRTHDIVLSGLE
eukprot:2318487-Amphidinium_carterae.1